MHGEKAANIMIRVNLKVRSHGLVLDYVGNVLYRISIATSSYSFHLLVGPLLRSNNHYINIVNSSLQCVAIKTAAVFFENVPKSTMLTGISSLLNSYQVG